MTETAIIRPTLNDIAVETLCGAMLRRADSIDSYAARSHEPGKYTDSDIIAEFPEYGAAMCYDMHTDIYHIGYATETIGEVYTKEVQYIDRVSYRVSICNISLYSTVTGEEIAVPDKRRRFFEEGIGGEWEYEC